MTRAKGRRDRVFAGAFAAALCLTSVSVPVSAGQPLNTVEMACPILYPSDVAVLGADTIVVGPEEDAEAAAADFLVCRIKPSGGASWTRAVRGLLRTEPVAVAVGPNGIYVGGNVLDDLGNRDGRIRRFGRGGSVQQRATIGTSSHDILRDVAAASDGRVYATGSTEGALVKNPPQPIDVSHVDAFVRAFDSDLDVRWTRQFRGKPSAAMAVAEGYAWGNAIAADEAGIYVTGVVRGVLPGWSGTRLGDDGFVRRYARDGTAQWTDQFDVTWSDGVGGDPVELDVVPTDIALSDQGVHVVGTSQWLGDRDIERREDAFQRVYRRNGTPRWTTEIGGWGDDGALKIVPVDDGSVMLGFAADGLGDPGDDSSMFLAPFGRWGSVGPVTEFQPDGWWLDGAKVTGRGESIRLASVIAAPLPEPTPDGLVVPPVGTNLLVLDAMPGWWIDVDVPPTRSHSTSAPMPVTVEVSGRFEEDPDHDPQTLLCRFTISNEFASHTPEWLDVGFRNGDPPISWGVNLDALSAQEVGTNSWTVECRNYYIQPEAWETDSGTIEIT